MFELSREHEEFRRSVRDFAEKPRSRRTPRSGTATTTSRSTWCRRWASSA